MARAAAAFALAAPMGRGRAPVRRTGPSTSAAWRAVRDHGTSLWIDAADLDASLQVWTAEFDGCTTNNALLNTEVQKGTYDELIPQAAAMLRRNDPGLTEDDLVVEIALVLNAVHGLALVKELDSDVSVELHTDAARDAEASYQLGRRLHAICPERFVVKIPLTPEGMIAARRLVADGVRVNCTLGFSPRQNRLVAEFAQPHFVNVFLGRVDELLESSGLPVPAQPGVLAAWCSQRALRERSAGATPPHPVRQIAASLRSGDQVAALAGIDVITMPVRVAKEFAAGGVEPGAVRDHAGDDHEPAVDPGAHEARADVFWDRGELAAVAARQLAVRDLDVADGDRVRAVLADNGLGDLFPDLTDDDEVRLAGDGKIPEWQAWQARVRDGSASWDGLLTAAGLAAFAAAQAELDDRVRRLL